MARMTKTTRKLLESILADMNRGLAYIDSPNVRVCRTMKPEHALTFDFTRPAMTDEYREHVASQDDRTAPDYALAPVDKLIGSDIAGLRQARHNLMQMLEAE